MSTRSFVIFVKYHNSLLPKQFERENQKLPHFYGVRVATKVEIFSLRKAVYGTAKPPF
jgi:hypothetical protein